MWPSLLLNPRVKYLLNFLCLLGNTTPKELELMQGCFVEGHCTKEHSSVKLPAHAVEPCRTVSPGLLCSSKLELSDGDVLIIASSTNQIREEQESVFSWKRFQNFSLHIFLFFFSFSLDPLITASIFSSISQYLALFLCLLHAEPFTFVQASLQALVWNKAHCTKAIFHSIQTLFLRGSALNEARGAGSFFVTPGPMSGYYCYMKGHHTPFPPRKMTLGQATMSMLSSANCRTSWGRWWHLHVWFQCCKIGFSLLQASRECRCLL